MQKVWKRKRVRSLKQQMELISFRSSEQAVLISPGMQQSQCYRSGKSLRPRRCGYFVIINEITATQCVQREQFISSPRVCRKQENKSLATRLWGSGTKTHVLFDAKMYVRIVRHPHLLIETPLKLRETGRNSNCIRKKRYRHLGYSDVKVES